MTRTTQEQLGVEVRLIREIFGKVEDGIEIAEEFDLTPDHNIDGDPYRELDKTMIAVHDSLNVTYHLLAVKLIELGVDIKTIHHDFPMEELGERTN